MSDKKLERVSKDFAKTVRKIYPYSSMYNITKHLNNQLEELLYGIKKDKKKR